MRVNQPNTEREFAFPPGETLVSVTDLKGRITYCNPSFIGISGYSREELQGQPHNVIRHPDMPAEAFRDMWETLQSGLPWTGLVKNRRRNGDHYWVRANATPMMNGDRITGFLSVRTQPTRDAITAAERLYVQMRGEAETGRLVHVLRRGQVVRRDLLGRARDLFAPGLRGKLLGVQIAGTAAIAACAGMPAMATAGIALLVAIAATSVIWRLAISPLNVVAADANRMASGDLAHPVATGAPGVVGELQQALMQLSLNLRTVVLDTRTGVESVCAAAQEIAAGNLDLSSRTEAQASSLQETAASMEQINATVKQSAEAVAQGAGLARDTAAVTKRSNEAVQAVVETMDGIAQSSNRIQDIIQVVEGVAFQTNILALNAAVEAARAGEAGRGFAVVATEVRALAKRTADAVREIKQLIAESSERVALGSPRSGDARRRMDEAQQAVSKVNAVLEVISTAAIQQQAGISQVNEAVTELDSITQQNAAMVEQLAATAQSLQGQVEAVNNSMRLFRLAPGDLTVAEVDAVTLRREAKAPASGALSRRPTLVVTPGKTTVRSVQPFNRTPSNVTATARMR